MKLLHQTEVQYPTLMRDIYDSLIGKEVKVFIVGGFTAQGSLEDWNGTILKVVNEESAIYIPMMNVTGIAEKLK